MFHLIGLVWWIEISVQLVVTCLVGMFIRLRFQFTTLTRQLRNQKDKNRRTGMSCTQALLVSWIDLESMGTDKDSLSNNFPLGDSRSIYAKLNYALTESTGRASREHACLF